MKTITFKLKSEKDAELLRKMLQEAQFESEVEGYIESDEDVSDEEIAIWQERLTRYQQNPDSALLASDVEAQLRKKHGL